MSATMSIEKKLGTLLLAGTLISTFIVLVGGALYLTQHGTDTMRFELFRHAPTISSIREVWQVALSFTPVGIIQLGLLVLVGTQLLRVAILLVFYASTRDYWFTSFCGFVLLILIYSFV